MLQAWHNNIFWILLFLYFSFGVEKTNTFIRSRGSLENHTRFKTIMVKIYTRFQTKTPQKPYPLGRHIPRECPPHPPRESSSSAAPTEASLSGVSFVAFCLSDFEGVSQESSVYRLRTILRSYLA